METLYLRNKTTLKEIKVCLIYSYFILVSAEKTQNLERDDKKVNNII